LTYLQQCNTPDRNPIVYSFSRLIANVANTNAHIYAREEQILSIRMIVLEEYVQNAYKTWKRRFWIKPPRVVAWIAISGGIWL